MMNDTHTNIKTNIHYTFTDLFLCILVCVIGCSHSRTHSTKMQTRSVLFLYILSAPVSGIVKAVQLWMGEAEFSHY